ncbi:MAG: hypothetical protein E6G05_08470 [Actinobacteria bacterium]|nr:MAG: hypothetical protein E6G05_08470 [Actinomycetota bacterium]
MGTGTSRLAAVAIAVVSAAAAGCGSGGQTQRGRSAQAGFAWLNPAPAPAGWPTVPIPSGAAVSYPPGWSRIHGDPGTATVALLGSGHQILGYLNVTPRQGPETLANFAHFRVDHNGDEGDHGITTLAATTKRRFGSGQTSCVQDSYATKTGARYVELACFVSGPRTSVVVVGAAPPESWQRVSPLIQRAISSTKA